MRLFRIGLVVGVALAGVRPADAQSQVDFQTYRGRATGEYTVTCGSFTDKGRVVFDFELSGKRVVGDVGSNWASGRPGEGNYNFTGKVSSDGTTRGAGVTFGQGRNYVSPKTEWFGRFRRNQDGTVSGRGSLTPVEGVRESEGCKGDWSVTGPNQFYSPGAKPAPPPNSCQQQIDEIQKAQAMLDELRVSLALKRATLASKGALLASTALSDSARFDAEIDRDDLFDAMDDLREKLSSQEKQVRSMRGNARAAGCGISAERDALEMEDGDDRTILVLYGSGRVLIEEGFNSRSAKRGEALRPRPGDPIVLRTYANSQVTIQIGSVKTTLPPNTKLKLFPRSDGAPDYILEQGGATVDKSQPGPFGIQTPTATANVNGTVFTVSWNQATGVAAIMVEEGRVTVRPTNPSLRSVMLSAREYVQVTNSAVSAVIPAPGASNTTRPEPPAAGRPPSPAGVDLTGIWVDGTRNGALYRVRQVGSEFWWTVDGTSQGSYTNMVRGTINRDVINGQWVDLPGSPSLGGGGITLRIESKDRFVMVGASAYGARVWTRLGTSPPDNPGTSDARVTGEVWQYQTASGLWTGTMTRRGTSDLFDAVVVSSNTRHVSLERVTIQGRTIRIERLESSLGLICTQSGTLQDDNVTYRGTGECGPGNGGFGFVLTRPKR